MCILCRAALAGKSDQLPLSFICQARSRQLENARHHENNEAARPGGMMDAQDNGNGPCKSSESSQEAFAETGAPERSSATTSAPTTTGQTKTRHEEGDSCIIWNGNLPNMSIEASSPNQAKCF